MAPGAADRSGPSRLSRVEEAATDGEGVLAVVSSSGGDVVLELNDEATFGRADHVALRIGRDPFDDELVAEVAGALSAWRGRVVVSNRSSRLAFDIAAPGRRLVSLAPGESFAPAGDEFTVVVQGTVRHELCVRAAVKHGVCRATSVNETALTIVEVDDCSAADHRTTAQLLADPLAGGPAIGRASRPGVLVLTARQRAVLDAYVGPMAQGLPPATHQQVAESIGVCRQTVRLECNSIWESFLAAGVPMRDWRDTRDAIADAWARHRL